MNRRFFLKLGTLAAAGVTLTKTLRIDKVFPEFKLAVQVVNKTSFSLPEAQRIITLRIEPQIKKMFGEQDSIFTKFRTSYGDGTGVIGVVIRR